MISYMRNKKIAGVVFLSVLRHRRGGERSQQKIARFECIQLFCLWALFKYDIIIYIHPVVLHFLSVSKVMKLLFSHEPPRDVAYEDDSFVRRLTEKSSQKQMTLLLRENFNNVLRLQMK